jgi:hypothetical protein
MDERYTCMRDFSLAFAHGLRYVDHTPVSESLKGF